MIRINIITIPHAYAQHPRDPLPLPRESSNNGLPFLIAAGVLVIIVAILLVVRRRIKSSRSSSALESRKALQNSYAGENEVFDINIHK